MKLKLVFLFMVLALVDANQDVEDKDDVEVGDEEVEDDYEEEEEVEECESINISLCHADLAVLNISPHTKIERCRVLWETLQCVDKVVDECAKKNGTIDVEGLEKFRKNVQKRCPRSPLDDANQDVEYLDVVEEEDEDYDYERTLEECKYDVGFCHGNLEVLNYRDHTKEERCKVLRKTSKCYDDVLHNCIRTYGELGLETLEEFIKTVEKECPLSPIEICRKILNNELVECIDIAGVETMEKGKQIHGRLPENFIQCSMYEVMKRCTADKVKEKCGEIASQVDVKDMLSHHADMIRNCERGF